MNTFKVGGSTMRTYLRFAIINQVLHAEMIPSYMTQDWGLELFL